MTITCPSCGDELDFTVRLPDGPHRLVMDGSDPPLVECPAGRPSSMTTFEQVQAAAAIMLLAEYSDRMDEAFRNMTGGLF